MTGSTATQAARRAIRVVYRREVVLGGTHGFERYPIGDTLNPQGGGLNLDGAEEVYSAHEGAPLWLLYDHQGQHYDAVRLGTDADG